jgi:hypothetical protein
VCHDADVRRLGAVAAIVAVLLAGACAGSSSHRTTSPGVAGAGPGPTGPAGSDCFQLLHRATEATLGASSFTVAQDAWDEHGAGAKVPGGGAAVLTYQAPNRIRVTPVVPAGSRRVPVEQIYIGRRAWQGSAQSGWVAFHTQHPSDPLYWLKVPSAAEGARWVDGYCSFTAKVPQGRVVGRVGIDQAGRITTLALTLTSDKWTIQMGYRFSHVGSSPRVLAP